MLLLLGILTWHQGITGLWAQSPGSSAPPASPTGFSADQLVEFAEQLMREGEYFRAITEYQRFLFAYPHDPRRAMMHFRIGIAWYRGQQYKEALQTFGEVAQRYPKTKYAKQARLWQGESLVRMAQYRAAEQVFTDILEQFPRDEVGHLARYQLGWTLLYQRQWHKASEQFQHVAPESHLYPAAQRLAEEVLDGEHLSRKSPAVAGLLSGVLPGSGQLYNGRVGDAALAFFLNGLFVVGILEAIHHDQSAIAGVLSFFEVGWYAGNIYGAVNGAHKHNRHAAETFLRNLENRFRVQPPAAHHPIGIRVSLNF
jgi:TolA-binding protein/TM2 domain-containing membrane protein YozV